ncbi:D-aminoacyl-tRNA deacylase [Robiginitalea sp. IMCC44478]|uniref:D-aminoacyl-tRNA deacylase n=1 Tax=Robiginitalea sp. IMCC44478 TaxID=3459122 RepID=UPI0040422BA8
MRALVQRVSEASVTVEGKVVAHIGTGLLVFLGVETEDSPSDVAWLAPKIANLRIFNDDKGVMNRSLLDVQGGLIVVSQFTLHAQTKKGNRPSYIRAARPEQAVPLYEAFVKQMETRLEKKVGTGIFGADMKVSLLNDGPVTIWIDTKRKE